MLIRRLILENYGLFSGRREIDLTPRVKYGKRRPIVLFGGKNGTGKTTLLEAIRLALYGRIAVGPRVRQSDYVAFLRARIHRAPVQHVSASSAKLAIEFDHVHRGVQDRYLVERSWRIAGADDISESLTVLKNDQHLNELDAEFWQGFVRDIIPEGLSQLFFFDGERIRELAEDATGAGVLAESIKSLLGLDLVERLDADLTVYSNREVTRLGSVSDREQSERCEADITRLREVLATTAEELASLRTRADGVQAEVRRAEENLRKQGEDLARRRTRLQSEAIRLRSDCEAAERSVRDQCDALFPLALCPKTASKLCDQLKIEGATVRAGHINSALQSVRDDLLKALTTAGRRKQPLTPTAAAAAKEVVQSIFAERAASAAVRGDAKRVHQLSESDQRRVMQWLSGARGQSRGEVQSACRSLTKWRERLEIVERDLAQIPTDAAVKPQLEALAECNRRLGALDQARVETEERSRRLNLDLEQKERELRKLVERNQEGSETGARIALASTVQTALREYLKRLTELKVSQLRETVAECFNRLCRKGDVIRSIVIDPSSFAVTLVDRDGRVIAREELSSGEKQIFAIAMLWGLAKTSGRPLPVIIDTPLGRLDSEHRRNLIHEYFPQASHQVILLSTDTEVDEPLFDELGPAVSHSYQLVYRHDESCTDLVEGYFWRKREEALCLS